MRRVESIFCGCISDQHSCLVVIIMTIYIYIYKITVAIVSIFYKNDFYDETLKHTHIEGEASFYDSYSA